MDAPGLSCVQERENPFTYTNGPAWVPNHENIGMVGDTSFEPDERDDY